MVNKRKTCMTIIAVLIVIVLIALFSVSCKKVQDPLAGFNVTTFNSDIVIKRVDGKEPLNMPYRYSMALLAKRLVFRNEIAGINISSVKYEISDTGLRLYNYKGMLVDADSSAVNEVIDSIKYCKGVTTLSGIIADKEDCKIKFYEGCSAYMLVDNLRDYAIIPSTLNEHINKGLSDSEKVFSIMNPKTFGTVQFEIIGEYTTKNRQDALYLSFAGLSRAVAGVQRDAVDHIECMEIDVNEEKDLTDLTYFLSGLFADYNMLSQYKNRINELNEPYPYMFVNTAGMQPIVLTEETDLKKNIITVTRIDGQKYLEMSHVYADALVKGYYKYSEYIRDIVISTGIKGVSRENYPPYGLHVTADGVFERDWKDYCSEKGIKEPPYHQAITSVSEIKSNKKNCEIFFYGNYTNRDLVMQREEDYRVFGTTRGGHIKGYAIVPAPMYEAARKHKSTRYQIIELFAKDGYDHYRKLFVGFKVIGYYKLPEDSTDEYDVVYISYVGNNDKYEKEAYKNEYIESIVIETDCDADMDSLTRYLRKFFAPEDAAEEYKGSKNELGLEYEYCYTIQKNVD
ncbi:MAG TPA: hypothetical protein PLZ06_08455 [Clostridia bacterium]|nr:hypothetical protein [Clostridia bacterium]